MDNNIKDFVFIADQYKVINDFNTYIWIKNNITQWYWTALATVFMIFYIYNNYNKDVYYNQNKIENSGNAIQFTKPEEKIERYIQYEKPNTRGPVHFSQLTFEPTL
jgi:preprotein translocase subunit SecY